MPSGLPPLRLDHLDLPTVRTVFRSIFWLLALLLTVAACARHTPPPVPDRDVSERPVSGPHLFYPTDLLVQRKQGRALVDCTVSADGTPRDCQVLDGSGGSEFYAAAVEYISQSRFAAAIRGGVPVETRFHWNVEFSLRGREPSMAYERSPPRLVAGYSPVYPLRMQQSGREGDAEVTCRITVIGFTKDCVLLDSRGGSAFADAALVYAREIRFAPELHHDVPVEVQHHFVVGFKLNPPIASSSSLDPLAHHPVVTPISEQPISGPPLAFPPKLLATGKHGSVTVRCIVTIQGATKGCLPIESTGEREFEEAGVEILSRARFAPAMSDGQPIEMPHAWELKFGDK